MIMSCKKFSTLRELEEYWDNNLDLTDDEDIDGTDIVELLPDRADAISDTEDIDENELEDTIPNDVLGSLEIHGGKCNEAVAIFREKRNPKQKNLHQNGLENTHYSIILIIEKKNARSVKSI